jgi:hypothetical protein
MGIAADKMAEVLALPQEDRAFLAHRLLASLDETFDPNSEVEWLEVIDRRSREIEGSVSCRPVDQVVQELRNKLHARRQPS